MPTVLLLDRRQRRRLADKRSSQLPEQEKYAKIMLETRLTTNQISTYNPQHFTASL